MSKPPKYSVPKHSQYSSYPVLRRSGTLRSARNTPQKQSFFKKCVSGLFNFFARQETKSYRPRPPRSNRRQARPANRESVLEVQEERPVWRDYLVTFFGLIGVILNLIFSPLLSGLSWLGRQIDRRARRTDFFRVASRTISSASGACASYAPSPISTLRVTSSSGLPASRL